MDESGSDRLQRISDSIAKGETPPGETVRTLLSWFSAERRGSRVVDEIRNALRRASLTTSPDFEAAYIDSIVQFRPETNVKPDATAVLPFVPPIANMSGANGVTPAETTAPDQPSASPSYSDPGFRLSKLAAANKAPVSVKPDATLAAAVTVMLTRDYSQLPVMTSERDVKGAISWRSIATRLALKRDGAAVREFMDPVEILPSDASLFEAIRAIVEKQYVLVQASDRRIVGIVTSSDVSVQFQALTEPFLLLSEIENDLRRVLQLKFSQDELASAKNPADTARTIDSVHDMAFGEYIGLLENPVHWQKMGLALDRRSLVEQLEQVRRIRNDVMHFDPDGIPPEDLGTLRDFSRFMQRLRDLRVT